MPIVRWCHGAGQVGECSAAMIGPGVWHRDAIETETITPSFFTHFASWRKIGTTQYRSSAEYLQFTSSNMAKVEPLHLHQSTVRTKMAIPLRWVSAMIGHRIPVDVKDLRNIRCISGISLEELIHTSSAPRGHLATGNSSRLLEVKPQFTPFPLRDLPCKRPTLPQVKQNIRRRSCRRSMGSPSKEDISTRQFGCSKGG